MFPRAPQMLTRKTFQETEDILNRKTRRSLPPPNNINRHSTYLPPVSMSAGRILIVAAGFST